MRRKRYLLFPLFFFLFCLPFCAEAQVGEKKLTVEFKNEEHYCPKKLPHRFS